MIDVKIDNESYRRTVRAFVSGFPKGLAASQKRAMRESVSDLTGALRADAAKSVASGEYSSKIRSKITGAPGTDKYVGEAGSDAYYGRWVEFGRAPGRYPNIDKIRGWVASKGMDEEATFLVARSIAQRGSMRSKRQPYETGWGHVRAVVEARRRQVIAKWNEAVERAIRMAK